MWRRCQGGRWEGQLLYCCQGEGKIFLHSPPLLRDSSLICVLKRDQLCWLTQCSFYFHRNSKIPLLSPLRSSGSPCLFSFSFRLQLLASSLSMVRWQWGQASVPACILVAFSESNKTFVCFLENRDRYFREEDQDVVTDTNLPGKYWAFVTVLREKKYEVVEKHPLELSTA